MLIQVGELAKRAGISVRTLHHYEETGLLLPSARSAAGYRLYNLADVQRLHMIRALARAGLELAQIRDFLEQGSPSLTELLDAQIGLLDKQMRNLHTLREHLAGLRCGLSSGEAPDLEFWMKTLELMHMYDRWFTKEELNSLPFFSKKEALAPVWDELAAELRGLLDQQVDPGDAKAMDLATRWMLRLEQDTAGRPEFLCRLNEMHSAEPQLGEQLGITPRMTDYVARAFAESKLLIWKRYLTPEEYAFARKHYLERLSDWPALVSRLHQAVAARLDPSSAEASELAGEWLVLFHSYAGTNPETHQKFRQAMEDEPHLSKGTWLTPECVQWLREAVAALTQK